MLHDLFLLPLPLPLSWLAGWLAGGGGLWSVVLLSPKEMGFSKILRTSPAIEELRQDLYDLWRNLSKRRGSRLL